MGGWGGLRQSNRWTGGDGWGGLRQSNRWTGGEGGVMKDRVTGGQVETVG